MIELGCDFNSTRDAGTLAWINPGQFVKPGDRVLLRDGDGNSCEGIVVEILPGFMRTYQTCRVELDMETWIAGTA